jgi:glycosyltransferase involved in cell wall biosynthesis
MKNTVLHFADYGGPYAGNFISSLTALAEVLKTSGYRQVLVFSDIAKNQPWLKELYQKEKYIYIIPKTSTFQMIKDINKIVKKENAQILHTHFITFDLSAWIVMKLRKLLGYSCSVIWHMHSPLPVKSSIVRWLKDTVKYRIVGKDVYSVVVSAGGFQTMLESGLRENRAYMIPNGIDIIKRIIQSTKTRIEMHQEFSVDDNIVLLHLGYNPILKGVDILLQSAKDLINHGLKIKILMVGTEALTEYVENLYGLNPPNYLRILPPAANIVDYFQGSDIFVSSSRAEGFSYAVAEAMSFGLPIVSSDIRGLEWAQESEGVEFFPNEDVEGLTEAIKKVIKWSPEEKKEKILANQKLIEGKYSIEIWAEQISELYKNILNGDSQTELILY